MGSYWQGGGGPKVKETEMEEMLLIIVILGTWDCLYSALSVTRFISWT